MALGCLWLSWSAYAAPDYKPEPPHPDYVHDRFGTEPRDIVLEKGAFLASFDSDDDGIALGVPEFVAYELKRYEGTLGKSPTGPSPWITDRALHARRIVPADPSYKYSEAFRRTRPNWYSRGHLCAQVHAWRLGAAASWNTHTVFNAVPQLQEFNNGIWKHLEELTSEWADHYGQVWIVTGPVFKGKKPRKWIGETTKGEMRVAVPDFLFKIVTREDSNGRFAVLAFRYPQDGPGHARGPFDHTPFLTSVDAIEAATGLDFFTTLPDAVEAELEAATTQELWNHGR